MPHLVWAAATRGWRDGSRPGGRSPAPKHNARHRARHVTCGTRTPAPAPAPISAAHRNAPTGARKRPPSPSGGRARFRAPDPRRPGGWIVSFSVPHPFMPAHQSTPLSRRAGRSPQTCRAAGNRQTHTAQHSAPRLSSAQLGSAPAPHAGQWGQKAIFKTRARKQTTHAHTHARIAASGRARTRRPCFLVAGGAEKGKRVGKAEVRNGGSRCVGSLGPTAGRSSNQRFRPC